MTRVDPFVAPIPRKILDDPELRPFFEYFVRWAHDIRERTGGGFDKIENNEFVTVIEDGGNRNSRFVIDEIERLRSELDSIKRANGRLIKRIQDLEDIEPQVNKRYELNEITEQKINRTYQNNEYTIVNKAGNNLESRINDLEERPKRLIRNLEHRINELEERIDNGT